MVQLQKDLDDIEATGIQIVGISYDSVDTLKKFSDEQSIRFLLLSDEGSATINAYGILNSEGEGYPHPGTFLVDQQGTVRAALFLEDYADRHTAAELIEAAEKVE